MQRHSLWSAIDKSLMYPIQKANPLHQYDENERIREAASTPPWIALQTDPVFWMKNGLMPIWRPETPKPRETLLWIPLTSLVYMCPAIAHKLMRLPRCTRFLCTKDSWNF